MTHFSVLIFGLINGLIVAERLREAPTGQIFLHQNLFSFKLDRIATSGIGHNSTIIGIIFPVIVVIALR